MMLGRILRGRHLSADGGTFAPHPKVVAFGMGKRRCLGEALAKVEMYVFFSAIVSRFEIRCTLMPSRMLTLNKICFFSPPGKRWTARHYLRSPTTERPTLPGLSKLNSSGGHDREQSLRYTQRDLSCCTASTCSSSWASAPGSCWPSATPTRRGRRSPSASARWPR